MAVYTIQTPGGKKLRIEAADEATALRGAQEWAAQNEQLAQDAGAYDEGLARASEMSQFASTGTAQGRYHAALRRVRESQFPDMTDEQWSEYAATKFGPDVDAQSDQSTTLGFADEISAAMGGFGAQLRQMTGGGGEGFGGAYEDLYELEQARLELAREQNGARGLAAEVVSGLATAGPAKVAQAVTQLPRLLQGVKAAAPAAGGGALYGFGSTDGDLQERGAGAGVGAGVGVLSTAVAPVAGRVIQGTARRVAQVPINRAAAKATQQAIAEAPSAATIKAGSKAAYTAAKETGAEVSQDAVGLFRRDVQDILADEGMVLSGGRLNIDDYPKVRAAVSLLDDLTQGPVTIRQAQTFMKRVRKAQASTDPDEARLGGVLSDAFEDFMDSLPDEAFVRGNGPEAVSQWAKGRTEWARYRRTATIEDAIARAQRAAGGFPSGLKGEFRRILNSGKKRRGFSQQDLAAMERYVQGGSIEDVLKFFANGGDFTPAAMVGALSGNPIAAGATLIGKLAGGATARAGLNRGAKEAAETLRASVATPGGLPQRPQTPPLTTMPTGLRALASQGAQPMTNDPRDALVRSWGR
jgi:hypothetical protein